MEVFETTGTLRAIASVTDALPVLVWLLDGDLRLEYANEAFWRFTGTTVDAIREPEQRWEFVHPGDRPLYRKQWEDAQRTRTAFEIDIRWRRADGAYRMLSVRVAPAYASEKQPHWVVTATDVEEVRRNDVLLHGIIETAPQMIWISRPDGFVEFWNTRLREYAGMTPDVETGIDWTLIVHPDDVQRAFEEYVESLREERRFEVQYRLRRHDGTYRWFLARAEPSRDANGKVLRWIGTATDIDQHKRSESAMELLLEATEIIAEQRELDAILAAIAELVVRDLADAATIYRRGRDGTPERLASSVRDPARAPMLAAMMRMYPQTQSDPVGVAMARNEPLVLNELSDEILDRTAQDRRHFAMLRELHPRAAMAIPLSARGEALGALYLERFRESEGFDERDLTTAQILANRLAGAIDEAMTRESERRLAETFQSSALPRRLPDLPGVEVKAIYQAAEVGINVGGDWYDAFELSPWRLVVSIGDVAGKGADAAATMALIRHGIRFAAHRGQDPADILGVVDHALRAESADLTATAFVAIVDIRESRVRYASAGHPPAALRLPNGRIRLLDVEPAPPLGTWPEGLRPRVEASPLVYGSLLVLYTDGLTEVERDPIAGERDLVNALHDEAVFASTNPARYLRDAVIGNRTVRDDVAVITLAYGRRRGWSFEAPDAMRAQPARASFERWLAEEAEGDAYASALIFGELVGNVVRHAPGPIEMRAEWRNDELVLHVFDTGPGFEALRCLPDASSESGRGLFIVQTLAKDLRVTRTPRGTRVSVTLPVTRRPYSER